MSQTPKKNWGHLHLPPDLIDAIRLLAKRSGFEGDEFIFLFKLLKQTHPEEMKQIIPLFNMEWMEDEPPG